ncbi:DNA polymerase III subunit gamma/tau [Candidatus Uhrbacteria bacterium]|nr:DNA polymerase III subunit gamma/tau [Candidatus Uhrbacteria bacterium]
MSTTLYRKYRPQTWDEIVDQNHVKITLMHEIEDGRIAHAYLFSGPRGLGKTTTARIFAKALNCEQKKKGSAVPCTTCDVCVAIRDGRALDVIEIDAASNTGVDNVRENIIAATRVAATQLQYKVFLIDEAHMLSLSAFNALLKTLEEPPPNVLFILATTEIHKIPETILSRCQRFDFRQVPVVSMVERLRDLATREGVRVDTTVLERIAEVADGSMRDAESVLGQVLAIGEKQIGAETADLVLPHTDMKAALVCLDAMINEDIGTILQCVETVETSGIDPVQYMTTLVHATQVLLHHALARGSALASRVQDTARLEAMSKKTNAHVLLHVLETLLQHEEMLRKSALPLLVLEATLLQAAQVSALPGRGAQNVRASSAELADESHAPAEDTSGIEKHGATGSIFSIEDLAARWDDVVAHVEREHRALAVVLRVGYPVAIEGNCVSIGFAYDFHRERVETPAMHALVQHAIADVVGSAIELKVVRAINPVSHIQKEDPLVSQILKTFGGEVVST